MNFELFRNGSSIPIFPLAFNSLNDLYYLKPTNTTVKRVVIEIIILNNVDKAFS